ncbi:hypothetical protein NCCP133_41250 [Cytobacillus sp. NCCP-133]|nr:hypothetical protein NCCP133_41250 [Cytobacillus sp. NCCP-133]
MSIAILKDNELENSNLNPEKHTLKKIWFCSSYGFFNAKGKRASREEKALYLTNWLLLLYNLNNEIDRIYS